MFTIYGGATEFNQWDQNQRVTESSLVAGDKVVFLNSSGMTHPMKAYNHNGAVVADVPNELLTMAGAIVVYINGHYETRTAIPVIAQEKPDGYALVDNTEWPSDNNAGCSCDGSSGGGGFLTVELTTIATADGAALTEAENAQLNEVAATGLPIILKCTTSDSLGVCGVATKTLFDVEGDVVTGYVLHFVIGSVVAFCGAGAWTVQYTCLD